MDLFVFANGTARWGDLQFRCALGRAGIRPEKREGDGATPEGVFAFRRVLYRADRLAEPETRLPLAAIRTEDGWCDAPEHADYNRPVTFPFEASAEHLWREDALYDLLLVPGFNDVPVLPGKGSAIFVHLATGDYAPTEGCVALASEDLQRILREASESSKLRISSDAP
ncbi:MAG: L,D-transpeptidase family protein [Alphaproteobacteria bacterium]|nr:L,D-transpeptidase family protein [Alphaproteobacteria bacterium]